MHRIVRIINPNDEIFPGQPAVHCIMTDGNTEWASYIPEKEFALFQLVSALPDDIDKDGLWEAIREYGQERYSDTI